MTIVAEAFAVDRDNAFSGEVAFGRSRQSVLLDPFKPD
jgi:hypothetical protein